MKHLVSAFVFVIAGPTLFVARSDAEPSSARPAVLAGGGLAAHSNGEGDGAAVAGETTGKVVETMDAGQYTYVLVDDGTKKIWAAAPRFPVVVGDRVAVPPGTPMKNFHSDTLDRTFDVVYFVGSIRVVGGQAPSERMAAAHRATGAKPEGSNVDLSNIEKAEGGQTVAELYAEKATLTGKEVKVRGKVTKFTGGVMGKNWIHVRDGTGAEGANDLTVTTSATAAVGDTVLVRGKLGADKDFGFGYKYELIVEDADVVKE